ncbi:putative sinapoylglucose--sinapoylglucose O-sinapoyltransferase [Helianthus annuus]|uniref:Putative peptidase S10, serine carboxypeptidase, Alpha/Beta hydrolase fold protein n=1 Tax=Helianthus annuus TaxID=4232 RepID=A0A251TNP1_HELAN|nr:serine carboxypeptidase-like 13 [Helianthus annuus]KAF5806172.1 putative sinapoylglucose--sinapoylglucose O-sinapoyltransferase [Helianthus annuus]KAJ0570474.1 putative sinapoylglucose--sinapoylglucose O-sinapoyltransferase [Helianthus annuus]KAJ0584819.1 putative sinapoylglucose--sinapoylglucose O-sinapoyltransferase [Helianthus annuus]KAJ0747397.1 putative sinapoylglucose--sinapoylglucose O-sinapoyltransferase [Helianthus annuus]KAJ0919239.1 putative sinapoylglucose--sinapoylglucose O-sin
MILYFVFILILQPCMITKSHSKSIITTLPGYSGHLPFNLETSYVGIGDVQLFYYFVESTRNPEEDPLILHISGGPGCSGLLPLLGETGPLNINVDNLTLTLNPSSWTQMANMIYVDMPVGAGFSYAETEQGWISSDTILATQANEFIKKFLSEHPKFLRNPLYISGTSYAGIIVPKVTLELYEYEGDEHGDQPFNIQGYIVCSPLTNKFMDFNSRLEYAYRMALISNDIHKSAVDSCHGNYVDIDSANSVCAKSLQRYEECTSHINTNNILKPFCDANDPNLDCNTDTHKAINKWAKTEVVQQALKVREGTIENFEMINKTLHYAQGKNDTFGYSYDIFSSFSYHKKLLSKKCRALIFSGDHDFTFPYVGVEQWIASLNLQVEVPWKPFYVDDQVGGYETKYAQNQYSLTYATVKGEGHSVPLNSPRESLVLAQEFFASQTYSSDS